MDMYILCHLKCDWFLHIHCTYTLLDCKSIEWYSNNVKMKKPKYVNELF